jgi:hypothetical protein
MTSLQPPHPRKVHSIAVGAGLPAMTASQPTIFHRMYLNPCGSWLASDDGFTADQFLTVGASLLARDINDNEPCLDVRGASVFFASRAGSHNWIGGSW